MPTPYDIKTVMDIGYALAGYPLGMSEAHPHLSDPPELPEWSDWAFDHPQEADRIDQRWWEDWGGDAMDRLVRAARSGDDAACVALVKRLAREVRLHREAGLREEVRRGL